MTFTRTDLLILGVISVTVGAITSGIVSQVSFFLGGFSLASLLFILLLHTIYSNSK